MLETIFKILSDISVLLFNGLVIYGFFKVKTELERSYERGYDAGRLEAAKESYEKSLQKRFDDLDKG